MIDVRGLGCPIPVVQVRDAIRKDTPDCLEVLADHSTAVQNITRLAESEGYAVSVEETDGEFKLTLKK